MTLFRTSCKWNTAHISICPILGAPNPKVAKASSQNTRGDPRESNSVPEKRKTNGWWIPGNRWMDHNPKTEFLHLSFTFQSEFGKEGTAGNFTFLSWPSTTDRDLEKVTLVRIFTLCQLLPLFPGSHQKAPEKVGHPSRSHLGHQTL